MTLILFDSNVKQNEGIECRQNRFPHHMLAQMSRNVAEIVVFVAFELYYDKSG